MTTDLVGVVVVHGRALLCFTFVTAALIISMRARSIYNLPLGGCRGSPVAEQPELPPYTDSHCGSMMVLSLYHGSDHEMRGVQNMRLRA